MPFFIMAGLGAVSSIAGGLISSSASSNAASTQAASADKASQLQWQEFQAMQQGLAPYTQAGTGALGTLQGALGLAGGTGAPNATALAASPGYQFMMGQGTQAINNTASARGGVNSGNTLKSLMSYGEGLGNQTFQQYIQNLLGLTQTGESAAAGVGSAGINTANIMGQNTIGAGNALAAGQVGGANAINSGIGGASQNALLAMMMNQNGGGGGYGGNAYGPTATPFFTNG